MACRLLLLAIRIAKRISKNPPSNLMETGSDNSHAPKRIAVKGLKPVAMAAWVGEIICKARPQVRNITAPPGTANKKITNQPLRSKFNEPLKG